MPCLVSSSSAGPTSKISLKKKEAAELCSSKQIQNAGSCVKVLHLCAVGNMNGCCCRLFSIKHCKNWWELFLRWAGWQHCQGDKCVHQHMTMVFNKNKETLISNNRKQENVLQSDDVKMLFEDGQPFDIPTKSTATTSAVLQSEVHIRLSGISKLLHIFKTLQFTIQNTLTPYCLNTVLIVIIFYYYSDSNPVIFVYLL